MERGEEVLEKSVRAKVYRLSPQGQFLDIFKRLLSFKLKFLVYFEFSSTTILQYLRRFIYRERNFGIFRKNTHIFLPHPMQLSYKPIVLFNSEWKNTSHPRIKFFDYHNILTLDIPIFCATIFSIRSHITQN